MVYAHVIVSSRTSVQELTYNVPVSIIPYIAPGSMVIVPLRKQKVRAVVVKLTGSIPTSIKQKIRDITSIEKSGVGFNEGQIKTIEDLAGFYGASFAEVAYHALSWPGKIENNKKFIKTVNPTYIQAGWVKRKKFYRDVINKYSAKHSIVLILPNEEYILDFLSENNQNILNVNILAEEKLLRTKLISGEKFIAIGSQKCAFIPLEKNDFLILESPDSISYKQQRRPLMSVKEVVKVRTKNENIRLIMGGNVLSVSDYPNEINNYWRVIRQNLDEFPIVIFDRKNTKSIISPTVFDEIEKYSSLLFLVGSKSWAPALVCNNCREVVRCKKCGHVASLQSSNQLVCPRCGTREKLPTHCDICSTNIFKEIGVGSQGLTQKLQKIYGSKIGVVSSDSNNIPNERIIVATEKIINFPQKKFEATVIVDIDWQLTGTSLNSSWHTLNTLLQLRTMSDSIFIQTYFPDHWVWGALRYGVTIDQYETELAERKKYHLPPFGESFTLIFAEGGKKEIDKKYDSMYENLKKNMPFLELSQLIIRKKNNKLIAEIYVNSNKKMSTTDKRYLRSLVSPGWLTDYNYS